LLARLAIVAALMLPPTLAMGASLPMLAAWVGRELENAGVQVATLYTVNTLGAATGCALAGFYLVAAVGVSATAQLACALDVAVGVAAVALAVRTRR
jgi:spermidine synthase